MVGSQPPPAAAKAKAAGAAAKKAPGASDIAWHSTAAMLGAGVIGLPFTFACLGYAGGIILLVLAIAVSRK